MLRHILNRRGKKETESSDSVIHNHAGISPLGLSLSLSFTLNKELSVSQIRFFCGHWITCGSDIFNFVQSRRYLFTKGIIFLCLLLKCLAPYRFGCKGKVENENRFIGGKTNIELKVKEKNNNRQIEKSVCRQDNTHIHVHSCAYTVHTHTSNCRVRLHDEVAKQEIKANTNESFGWEQRRKTHKET